MVLRALNAFVFSPVCTSLRCLFPVVLCFIAIEIHQRYYSTDLGFRFCQELKEGRGATVLHVIRTDIRLVRERRSGGADGPGKSRGTLDLGPAQVKEQVQIRE